MIINQINNQTKSKQPANVKKVRMAKMLKMLKEQKYLHMMVLPAILFMIVFSYIPMLGLQIAFKDYMFNKGIWFSPYVGLKHFMDFFTDPNITPVLVNTLGMSLLKVFFVFPVPIILALMLNEIGNIKFKRITQTVSYFPYFISWVVISLMCQTWLAPNGFVNDILVALGIFDEGYLFLGKPEAFWLIALFLEIWKNAGWGSIIYLAAMAGVDQEMYEAAEIDGANRFDKIIKITLPVISGTIMIMFILNIGSMLSGGLYGSNFQVSYLLGNPLNQPRSEILDTYILKVGISLGRYSYATAVGILSSLVSFILLITANTISRKSGGESFF